MAQFDALLAILRDEVDELLDFSICLYGGPKDHWCPLKLHDSG